ncbi:MAG TPA: hypothetical protein ENN87_00065 [Phycisphaerales bacterium]|nr:hypothetical protein [Phycisphaerales bacterium]
MKKLITTLMGLAAVLLALSGTALAGEYGKQKAVYHINGGDAQQNMAALRNVQNHINAVGAENMEVKVVMHGGGVELVRRARDNEDLRTRIDSLKVQNVEFQVCANTLKGKGIDYKADLYDVKESDIVPSGVAHLSHLQGQGYTYVKP